MVNARVTSLLDDAYLVLEYAVRAGRLPDDALATAIKDVEAGSKDGFMPSMVTLSKAMNVAVAAIAPVTLMDLRAGRSPFEKQRRFSTRVLQYALCVVTALLAYFIASFSFDLQHEQSAVREYEALQAAQIGEKTNALRRLVQQDNVLERRDARYDLYLRNLRELKELDGRREANYDVLLGLANAPTWALGADMLRAAFAYADRFLGGDSSERAPLASEAEANLKELSPEDACEQPARQKPRLRNAGYTSELRADAQDELCFAVALNLGVGTSRWATPEMVSTVRDRIVLKSAWILPFLTGLLGAAVFLLRDSLDPTTANFGAPRAFVRLSIGAVAGIIIGWFWTPSGPLGTELGSVSSVPLALAFVTGFSIDILFSVLDRVRRAVSTADAGDKK